MLIRLGVRGIEMKIVTNKYFGYWFLLFSLFSLFFSMESMCIAADTNNAPELMSNYELASGDQIRILVFREADMTLETVLTDTGTIIFPFLGEINVAGLTVGKLKEKLTLGLRGRYLVDPIVSVSVLKYREFFVNGEVKKPGSFPYFPGLTVQKAISMAGGFSERASQSSVMLIREKDVNHQASEVKLNANVGPGDVVIVEESFF